MSTEIEHPLPEQLAAYAQGKLDPEQARSVELHLQSCADCRQSAAAPRKPFWRRIPYLAVGLVLAVGALIVLTGVNIALANQIQSLDQQHNTLLKIIHNNQANLALISQPGVRLVGCSGAQGAGNLLIAADGKTATLFLQKLPTLDAEHTFQVWLVPAAGTAWSAGTFQPRMGQPYVPFQIHSDQPLSGYKSMQVTVEPKAGSQQPTTQPILTVNY